MLMNAVEGGTAFPLPRLATPLPPVSTPIPAWPRPGHPIDRTRFPRPSRRDRLQALSQPPMAPIPRPPSSPKPGVLEGNADTEDDRDGIGSSSVDPLQRIFRLERSLRFLREQHQLVLSSLQNEVEELKNKNRELQFQVVMGSSVSLKDSETDSAPSSTILQENQSVKQLKCDAENTQTDSTTLLNGVIDAKSESFEKDSNVKSSGNEVTLEIELLRNENNELKAALQESRNRNVHLTSLIEQIKRNASEIESRRQKAIVETQQMPREIKNSAYDLPLIYARKFEEYEDVIQQMRRDNEELHDELARLKGTMREILSSNKWTPEAYLLAHSVLEEGGRGREHIQRLPRIPPRPHDHHLRRHPSLPAIHPHNYIPMRAMVRHQPNLPNVAQGTIRGHPPASGRIDQRRKPPNGQSKP